MKKLMLSAALLAAVAAQPAQAIGQTYKNVGAFGIALLTSIPTYIITKPTYIITKMAHKGSEGLSKTTKIAYKVGPVLNKPCAYGIVAAFVTSTCYLAKQGYDYYQNTKHTNGFLTNDNN